MPDNGPITSEQCQELLFDGRGRLEALLSRIDDVYRDGEDGWSAKDHLLHLANWQRRVVEQFEAGNAGRAIEWPEPGFTIGQTDQLNDRDWRMGRDRSMEEVHQAFTESYDRLDALIAGMTDEDFNDPTRFPWLGFEAREAIVANSYAHYGDHIDALEELVLSSELPA